MIELTLFCRGKDKILVDECDIESVRDHGEYCIDPDNEEFRQCSCCTIRTRTGDQFRVYENYAQIRKALDWCTSELEDDAGGH